MAPTAHPGYANVWPLYLNAIFVYQLKRADDREQFE